MEEEGPKILDVGSGFATLDCSQRFAQFDHILIYILTYPTYPILGPHGQAPGSLARDWSQIDDSLFLNRPAESAESVESLSDSEHAAKVLVSDLFTRQVLREV